jgi:FdhE protein
LWLELVELAVAESRQPSWCAGVLLREDRPPDAPLLHHATLQLSLQASEFVRHVGNRLGIVATEAVDPASLTRLGIERDIRDIDSTAARLAVSADATALLAQLVALPLLLNAATMTSEETSRAWQRGYCPVCGAWPAMVEMRGIQRERWMRCGCCGSGWELPVLRCTFCDETDHKKLGSLLSEAEQHVRVETCATCRGYLKSVTTLSAMPFVTLATKDMSTVSFDLAARDRGYARPTRPGFPLRVDVVR